MAPVGHSRFGASSSHRWTACPGSVEAQDGIPNVSGAAAAEGTALHAVTEWCVTHKRNAAELIGKDFDYEDHGTQTCIRINEAQADAVQLCVDTVAAENFSHVEIEKRFHLRNIDDEFFGTCDLAGYRNGEHGYPAAIIDYKFGVASVIEARRENGHINKQLGYYALGAIGDQPITKGVELVVAQPRAYHPAGPVRRTFARPEELQALREDLLRSARMARSHFAPRRAGDHCKYCRAAGSCATLKAFAHERTETVFGDDGPVRAIVPTEAKKLAYVLEAASVVQWYVDAAREYAQTQMAAGVDVPGWTLRPKRPVRKWKDEEAATAEILSADFGLDRGAIFDYRLRSPAQVEKLLTKAQREELKRLWGAESSGHVLDRSKNGVGTKRPIAALTFETDTET